MSEMAALWGTSEEVSFSGEMEQLGQKLLYTTLELEKLKSETDEEMRKNKEYIRQLINILRYAVHERDEAKKQLHDLRTTLLVGPQTSIIANSSITESNSLGSSPISEFPSPPDHDSDISAVVFNPNTISGPVDHLDALVRGLALPQRGKFLEAVLRAGPLLQTLLVAGPMPRWRNPPQMQPNRIVPPPLPLVVGGLSQRAAGLNLGLKGYGVAPQAKRQRFC